jgi:hypothetical protein
MKKQMFDRPDNPRPTNHSLICMTTNDSVQLLWADSDTHNNVKVRAAALGGEDTHSRQTNRRASLGATVERFTPSALRAPFHDMSKESVSWNYSSSLLYHRAP